MTNQESGRELHRGMQKSIDYSMANDDTQNSDEKMKK